MNAIKQRLLTNWHLMRIVRLVIGIMMLVAAIQSRDWMVGVLSSIFLYQAITGTGCCGSQGCYAPPIRKGNAGENKLESGYEEIK